MTSSALRLVAFATALALAGCAGSPPTTLLTLDVVAPPADAIRADYRGQVIAIPAVHVPAVLDRAEFVQQVSDGAAKVDDFARWAAPLGVLTRDALVRDMTARLPEGSVLPPGSIGGKRSSTLDVTILSFDTTATGATMQAAWRRLPQGTVHQLSLMDDYTALSPVNAARAYAALLAKLADRMSMDL